MGAQSGHVPVIVLPHKNEKKGRATARRKKISPIHSMDNKEPFLQDSV